MGNLSVKPGAGKLSASKPPKRAQKSSAPAVLASLDEKELEDGSDTESSEAERHRYIQDWRYICMFGSLHKIALLLILWFALSKDWGKERDVGINIWLDVQH